MRDNQRTVQIRLNRFREHRDHIDLLGIEQREGHANAQRNGDGTPEQSPPQFLEVLEKWHLGLGHPQHRDRILYGA